MTSTVRTAVVIYASEWFERVDFREWIRRGKADGGGNAIAGWFHDRLSDEEACIFVTWYRGDGANEDYGSDETHMPGDIWSKICAECRRLGLASAVIWVRNSEYAYDPYEPPATR